MYDELLLANNQAIHSFEMIVNGQRAFIDYKQRGDTYYLIHTEVPKALQGQGIAAALVERTFKYLEENHLKMRPYCEYIQAYLKRHPEWERLVAK
jgi:uncharacterized protein